MLRCYITDRLSAALPLATLVARAWTRGADWVQVREKDLDARALAELVGSLLAIPRPSAAKLLVNTRLDVALATGADGCHLPSGSPGIDRWRRIVPAGFLLGTSCHDLSEVQRAEAEGADYVVLSPIFDVPGKGQPLGITGLREVVRRVKVPVLALGGLDEASGRACGDVGAAGYAAIRSFQETGSS